jgi:hypothetical protein
VSAIGAGSSSAVAPGSQNPVVAAILSSGQNVDTQLAMLVGSKMESGWSTDEVGDGGTSFGPFQMHQGGALTSAGYSPADAENPTLAVKAMEGSYANAAASIPASLWQSNPAQAAEQAAVAAERPAKPYDDTAGVAAVNAAYAESVAALNGAIVAGTDTSQDGGVFGSSSSGSGSASDAGLISTVGGDAASGLLSALGISGLSGLVADAERLGLVLFGGLLIIVGLIITFHDSPAVASVKGTASTAVKGAAAAALA